MIQSSILSVPTNNIVKHSRVLVYKMAKIKLFSLFQT